MGERRGTRRRASPRGWVAQHVRVLVAPVLLAGMLGGEAAQAGVGRGPRVGVDYYPEQWPRDQMRDDLRAIREDLGADLVRVGEFLWGELEPADGVFNFTLLDEVVLAAEEAGLAIVLGTPTATMPAWLYHTHGDAVAARAPDSGEGYSGATPGFGGRRQYSFNSKVYLRYATRIVDQLARRYGQRPSIAYWQVDNELGHEGSDLDFSPMALEAWQDWVTTHYDGDIHALNQAWGTRFWSATYASFDEVGLPTFTYPGGTQQASENFRSNLSPGMLLDYRRFRRDSITAFANAQVTILRSHYVRGEITSNAPGGFWGKAMDHDQLFGGMDLPAYDNYPVWGGSLGAPLPSSVALSLDTVRGWVRDPSKGWMVAEQLIGAQGHDIIGYTPRPNQAVAWSAATFLHGATSLLFFRYRAAVFGQEEFCYGVLDHTTPVGTGRKWKEATAVFDIAKAHADLWMQPPSARVALMYDTDNIFSWQAQPQSTAFDFTSEALRLYHPFWRHGAAVDVLSARRFWQEELDILDNPDPRAAAAILLARCSILLLPAPMILPGAALFPSDSSPEAQSASHSPSNLLVDVLDHFVRAGGSLWISFRSDIKDAANQMRRQPSRLAALAGVQVTEIESLNQPLTAPVALAGNSTTVSSAEVFREGLSPIPDGPSPTAEPLWIYTDSFFGSMGLAAVTRRPLGKGEVVYVGTGIDGEELVPTATETLAHTGVHFAGLSDSPWVEEALRKDVNGKLWRLAINHGDEAAVSSIGRSLDPYEVVIEPEAERESRGSPVQ